MKVTVDIRRRAVDADPDRLVLQEPPWAELDAGIVETVRWLWHAGFYPTDSGDGVSKPDMECALDVPNVFMVVRDPRLLVSESNRLHSMLWSRFEISIDQIGTPNAVTIEASYDPAIGLGVIALLGLCDAKLPKREVVG